MGRADEAANRMKAVMRQTAREQNEGLVMLCEGIVDGKKCEREAADGSCYCEACEAREFSDDSCEVNSWRIRERYFF